MDGIQAAGTRPTATQSAGRPHGHHGQHKADMLKKFDTNNDGKIDDAERKAAREQLRAKFGGRHGRHAEEEEVADSNSEAAQSAGGGTGAGQYGPEGQAPAPGQPTLDVTG